MDNDARFEHRLQIDADAISRSHARGPGSVRRRDLLIGATSFAVVAAGRPTGALGDLAPGREVLLRAEPGRIHLRGPAHPASDVATFDGALPGPTLRVARGAELRVRLANALHHPLALHWHGIRSANALVGTPPRRPRTAPGDTGTCRFVCADAGTFWYRATDNAHGHLYGLVVVEETVPVAVDRDLALMIGDWRLTAGGSLAGGGAAAVTTLVAANAAPAADVDVRTHERLRLRLVNAGTTVMRVRVAPQPAIAMALDGQPIAPFVVRDGVVALGPGNRIDLFLDLDLPAGTTTPVVVETDHGDTVVARLVYAAGPPARPAPLPPPDPLPPNPLPERMAFAGAARHDLVLGPGAGAEGPADRPLVAVPRGRTVMLGLVNRTDAAQVVHIDGHHVRLLDRLDDGWKPFWLDTLTVPPAQTMRIAFVADNPGAWQIDTAAVGGGPTAAAWFEVR